MSTKAKLFVANLPKNVTVAELKELFEKYGTLRSEIQLKKNKEYYAFVEYEEYSQCEEAQRETDGHELGGKHIKVEVATGKRNNRKYSDQKPRETDMRCHICDVRGHLARDCPTDDRKGRCYKCGSKYHRMSDCDKRRDRSLSRSRRRTRHHHRSSKSPLRSKSRSRRSHSRSRERRYYTRIRHRRSRRSPSTSNSSRTSSFMSRSRSSHSKSRHRRSQPIQQKKIIVQLKFFFIISSILNFYQNQNCHFLLVVLDIFFYIQQVFNIIFFLN